MEPQNTYFEEQRLELERERNELLRQQNAILSRIGATIGKLNTTAEFLSLAIINKTVCRFSYPLESFATFDWDAFGATIHKADRSGVAVVVWRGDTYTRRSFAKNGNDVWYSRLIGTTEGGKHIYDILIKFSEAHGKVSSLPDEVKDAAGITHSNRPSVAKLRHSKNQGVATWRFSPE